MPTIASTTSTNTWEVNEKLTTVFVKFGIDTELGEPAAARQHRRAGDPADQTSDLHLTTARDSGRYRRCSRSRSSTEGAKYTDMLPSLNLALELPHDMKLRFGAAITVGTSAPG